MRMHVGASGFSYPAWKPSFYPPRLPQREFLHYYASKFDAVEINATFYGMPAASTLANWRAQVGDEFRFALKAPQRITHRSQLRDCAEPCARFFERTASLGPARGPVLFQLPPRLQRDLPRLDDFLQTLPPIHQAAFEFRHESWFDEAVFDLLRAHGAALCIADTPNLKTPWVATADFGYLRLRQADYTADSLRAWQGAVLGAPWREAFIFFKHDDEARAPLLADSLRSQLGSAA